MSMLQERKLVCFGSFENAVRFSNKAEHLNAQLYLKTDHELLNAKSVLCLASMNLEEKMVLEMFGDENSLRKAEEAVEEFVTE